MTPALPSLEEPEPGTCCPQCAEPLRLSAPAFCAGCFELAMRAREAAIRADLAKARKRARTWQLGRAVQA
jgi:hypothetical protein